MTDNNVIITVKNLYKTFDGKKMILSDISHQIKKGEKVAVIGPSGGGKSTFLRCMNLLETPTAGEVWLENDLITDCDPALHAEIASLAGREKKRARLAYEAEHRLDINLARQKMGMVFQHFNLFAHMTVKENITFAPIKLKLKTPEEAHKKAENCYRSRACYGSRDHAL